MKKIAALIICIYVFVFGSIQVDAKDYDKVQSKNDIFNSIYQGLLEQKDINVVYPGIISDEELKSLVDKAFQVDDKNNNYDNAILYCSMKSVSSGCKTVNGNTYISVSGNYRYDNNDLKNYINETVIKLNLDGMSDHEKLNAIYDFVTASYSYDYEHKAYDCINAQSNDNKMVCQGYSTLMYLLCKEAGLDIEILMSETHSWNCIRLDGDKEYIQFDATNGYKYGDAIPDSDNFKVRADYFTEFNKNITVKENMSFIQKLKNIFS